MRQVNPTMRKKCKKVLDDRIGCLIINSIETEFILRISIL